MKTGKPKPSATAQGGQVSVDAIAEVSKLLVQIFGLKSATLKRLTEVVREVDQREAAAARIIAEADARDAALSAREQAVTEREETVAAMETAISLVAGELKHLLGQSPESAQIGRLN